MARSTRQTVLARYPDFPRIAMRSTTFPYKRMIPITRLHATSLSTWKLMAISRHSATMEINSTRFSTNRNLRAVAMASGYRLSPGIPSDSSTCLQSGQRSVSSNMTTLHFLHLFIIYSVRLNLHIHTIRRNLAEKCLLYQSLGKDGTECKYQRILVRTDRSFQILPF